MRLVKMSVWCLGFLAVCGCIPDDAERCREGFVLIDADCWPATDTVYDTDSSLEPDTETGSNGQHTPTGLGDACTSSEDCAGKEADYCALDPAKPDEPGGCTLSNCNPGPTICPQHLGLVCCAFSNIEDYPSMCIPVDVYEEYKSIVGC